MIYIISGHVLGIIAAIITFYNMSLGKLEGPFIIVMLLLLLAKEEYDIYISLKDGTYTFKGSMVSRGELGFSISQFLISAIAGFVFVLLIKIIIK